MESSNILITFIVNHGDAYDIMETAREAGARGGTIVNAHGTGKESDVTFFGVSLMSEKEMLIIMAEKDLAKEILNAVKDLPVFKRPGGGIIYTSDVKQFVIPYE
jgi:nitrogen regulatory protein PII